MPSFGLLWLVTLLTPISSHVLRSFRQRVVRHWGEADEPPVVQLPLRRTKEGWYTVQVQLAGSPAHLLVDTGSSALWARTSVSSKGVSTSSKAPLGNFTAQYGRGAVSGEVVEASMLLPGALPAKARSCRVGLPIDEGAFWARQRSIDGVLGLGCSSEGAAVDALACVVPVLPQRPLLLGPPQHRVFCLQLTPTGGTLTLGSVPQTVQLNSVPMPPASDCGHWTVPLRSLSVQSSGSSSSSQKLVHDAEAILDSGSDGIIGPTFAVIELANRLGASPGKAGEGYGGEVTFYEVSCDAALNLPSVTLDLGNAQGTTTSVTLRGSDLVKAGRDGEETCHLRVAGWETQSWILGAVFLTRLQGVSFDVDSGIVSIAPPAQSD